MTFVNSLIATGGGSGDMTKSVYDTNNDGTVDSAATAVTASAVAWTGVTGKPSTFTPSTHSHAISDVTGLQTALDAKQATLTNPITGIGINNEIAAFNGTGTMTSLATATYPSLTELSYVKGLTSSVQSQLNGKQASGSYASATHAHSIADVTGLQTALDGKQASGSYLTANQSITLSGAATGTGSTSIAVSITRASAFATATTTISTATYMDITGCSVSLAAGTWLVIGNVVGEAANLIIQMFVAITDGTGAVVAETAQSRPASGTASLNSPISCSVFAIVAPTGTTTYKLMAARGLTTHTSSWTALDGNGVNTTNHATNNTDKGTGIFAVKLA